MVGPVSSLSRSMPFVYKLTLGPADDPRQAIVDAARRLDERQVPVHKFGIQFVQIGDDPDATEALKELDDELGPANGVRVRKRSKSSSVMKLILSLFRIWWTQLLTAEITRKSIRNSL